MEDHADKTQKAEVIEINEPFVDEPMQFNVTTGNGRTFQVFGIYHDMWTLREIPYGLVPRFDQCIRALFSREASGIDGDDSRVNDIATHMEFLYPGKKIVESHLPRHGMASRFLAWCEDVKSFGPYLAFDLLTDKVRPVNSRVQLRGREIIMWNPEIHINRFGSTRLVGVKPEYVGFPKVKVPSKWLEKVKFVPECRVNLGCMAFETNSKISKDFSPMGFPERQYAAVDYLLSLCGTGDADRAFFNGNDITRRFSYKQFKSDDVMKAVVIVEHGAYFYIVLDTTADILRGIVACYIYANIFHQVRKEKPVA